MFTFRTSITFAVMAFIVALAALLIAIQVRSLRWATQEAASAYMDAASTKALGRLQTEMNAIASLVNVLATSSSVADSNERSETGRAIPLFKAALQEMPQMDSIYAGFENGAWLQVRRTSDLNEEQRERLRAPANANIVINLVRPTPAGDLPMRRIFQDRQGNEVGEVDLWKYGYDARKRPWYRQTMRADRPLSHRLIFVQHRRTGDHGQRALARQGARRACRRSQARHLQRFRPGAAAGSAWHRHDFRLRPARSSPIPILRSSSSSAMTHPSRSQLPSIKEINSGVVAAVLRRSHGRDQNEGSIRDDEGRDYLFRVTKFALGEAYGASILLLAAQDDFVQNVRKLQFTGLILAIIVGAAFIPVVWIFGGRMSRSLKAHHGAGRKLQTLAAPDPVAGDVAYQGNSRTRQHRESRAARDMVVRAFRSQGDRPAGHRQFHLHQARRCQAGDHRSFSPTSRDLRRSRSPPIPTCSCSRRRDISPC